ncbi:MAG: hypothetical protein QM648_00815, partial [Solirubrobacterales bacterium]
MSAVVRSRLKPLSALLLSLLLISALSGCGGSDKKTTATSTDGTWRIGLQAPLTGDLSVLGAGMLGGAELAEQEINDSGG